MVDQLIDRILFGPWVGSEIRQPMKTTQKSGWSPFPAGYQRLLAEFPVNESMAVDKTLWDWTMPEWVISLYVCVKRQQMVEGDDGLDDRYWHLVWARLYYVLGPGARFRCPSGEEWQQQFWGLMKSGMFLTLSLNSMAQDAQHVLAWIRAFPDESVPLLWAMGDDTLIRMSLTDDETTAYVEALESTGCSVKKIERSREFCGYMFNSADDVRPLYPEKHRFIIAHVNPSVEQDTLFAYELLYALSGDRWVDRLRQYQYAPLGPVARMWARGLVRLNVLKEVPQWADY